MKKTLLIPVFCLIIFLFAVYFIVPGYRQISHLKSRAGDKRNELEKFKKYFEGLNEIEGLLESQSESLAKIESALPDEFSLAEIFNFFQLKAEENGLLVKTLNEIPGKSLSGGSGEGSAQAAPKRGLKEHYIAADLEGGVSGLENFLVSLENSSRIIEILEVSLKSEKEGFFKFFILCKAYSY